MKNPNPNLHIQPPQFGNNSQTHYDPNLPTMKQMRLDFPIFDGDVSRPRPEVGLFNFFFEIRGVSKIKMNEI